MAEQKQFSWKKALWKGARPALVAAGAAFVVAMVPEPGALEQYGVPAAFTVFVWEAGRNWMREHGYLNKK
jgi:hypothetical protein